MFLPKRIQSHTGLFWSPVFLGAVGILVPVEYIAGCILLLLALLAIILIYTRDRQLAVVLLAGLILRAVLIYADHFVGFLPDQPDQVMYNNQALEILQNWNSGMYPIQTEEFAKGTSPFSYLLAVLYLPFGYMPLLGRLFNALISLLCVYCFYYIIVEILDERRIALLSSALLTFLPSFIVFSSYILRDILIMLLSLIILYALIKISKRCAITRYVVLLVLAFILNALLRIQNLFLYAGFFLVFSMVRALTLRSIGKPSWRSFSSWLQCPLLIMSTNPNPLSASPPIFFAPSHCGPKGGRPTWWMLNTVILRMWPGIYRSALSFFALDLFSGKLMVRYNG